MNRRRKGGLTGFSMEEAVLTAEEMEIEAEEQLSTRLRSMRFSLKQRQAVADAANYESLPLLSEALQRPGVMLELQQYFKKKNQRRRSISPPRDDGTPTASVDNADSSVTSRGEHPNAPKESVSEDEFVNVLWGLVVTQGNRQQQLLEEDLSAPLGNSTFVSDEQEACSGVVTTRKGTVTLSSPPPLMGLRSGFTPALERQYRAQFRKAFQLCDASQCGGVTWATLTSYLLDSTLLMKNQREIALALPQWYQVHDYVITPSHRPRQLKRVFGTNDILIVDGSGVVFQYGSETHKVKLVEFRKHNSPGGPLLPLIDAEFIPGENGICFTTVGAEIFFFDLMHKNLERTVMVDSGQMLVWHPVLRRLVCGDREGSVTLWTFGKLNPAKRTKSPLLFSMLELRRGVAVQAIECGLRSPFFVVGYTDGTVYVLHGERGAIARVFTTPSKVLNCLALSEHQSAVVCGTIAFKPEIWSLDPAGGQTPFLLEARIVPHSSPIVSLLCVAGTPQCISIDFAGTVKVWHMQLLICTQTFVLHKQDPRLPWRSLVEVSGYLLYTDRISIAAFHVVEAGEPIAVQGSSNEARGHTEHVMVERGHTVDAISFPGSLISASGSKLMAWDVATQRLTSEVDPTLEGQKITSLCSDAKGLRCFVGTANGDVWIVNVSTLGAMNCFAHAHGKRPVVALCFMTHVNLAISLGADGSGMLLSPMNGSSADSFLQRGQSAFYRMDGGLLLYIGPPWLLVVAADKQSNIYFYSSAEISTRFKLDLLATGQLPQIPNDEASSAPFLPKGRCLVSMSCIASDHAPLLAVADNNSVAIVSLVRSNLGGRDPQQRVPKPPFTKADDFEMVLVSHWNTFTAFDNVSISKILSHKLPTLQRQQSLKLVSGKSPLNSPQGSLSPVDDANNFSSVDFLESIANVGSDVLVGELTVEPNSPVARQPSIGVTPVASSPDGQHKSESTKSAFDKSMEELINSKKTDAMVLDPQITLLKAVGTTPMKVGDHGDRDAHFIVIGFESGTLSILDVSTVVNTLESVDPIQLESFAERSKATALRSSTLRTVITSLSSLHFNSVCVGLADGLVDIIEVPSLGLMWSGHPAVAESQEYFPPTSDLTRPVVAGRFRLQNTVSSESVAFWCSLKGMVPNVQKDDGAGGKASSPKSLQSDRTTCDFGDSIASFVIESNTPVADNDEDLPEGENSEINVLRDRPRRITLAQLRPGSSASSPSRQAVPSSSAAARGNADSQREWILGQLSTLCNDHSFLTKRVDVSPKGKKRGDTLLRVTPSGVEVFQGNDPFSDWSFADSGPGGPKKRLGGSEAPPTLINDNRKSDKQRYQEKYTVKNMIPMKKFDDLGVSRPSSSRSFVSDTNDLPRHVPPPIVRGSLLRPLSSAHKSVSSSSSDVGSSQRQHAEQQRPMSSEHHTHESVPLSTELSALRRPVSQQQMRDVSAGDRTIHGRSTTQFRSSLRSKSRNLMAVEPPPWLQ